MSTSLHEKCYIFTDVVFDESKFSFTNPSNAQVFKLQAYQSPSQSQCQLEHLTDATSMTNVNLDNGIGNGIITYFSPNLPSHVTI